MTSSLETLWPTLTIAIFFKLVFGFGGTPLGGREGEMERNSQCKESNDNTDPKVILESTPGVVMDDLEI